MKSWVDTVANKNNTWLVLVFHGIDGLGYEALPHTLLDEYFQYIKSKDSQLWIATFGDVTKYMREREATKIKSANNNGKITVTLNNMLDNKMYDLPLTLKTYVPSKWKKVKVSQGKHSKQVSTLKDAKGNYVLYQASTNITPIALTSM